MLDIDTAIKHCLEVAEQKETQADKWQEEGGEEWGKTTACRECAAEHRQLAEWLREAYRKYREHREQVYAEKMKRADESDFMRAVKRKAALISIRTQLSDKRRRR